MMGVEREENSGERNNVSVPILGIDFLRQHKLLVDEVGARLLPRDLAAAGVADAAVNSISAGIDWASSLTKFPPVS
jgi:hypothetical protein